MARFTFRLQKVLEHRQRLEDEAKHQMAKVQAAHAEQAALVGRLESDLSGFMQQSSEAQVSTVAELELRRLYRERLLHDMAQAKARLQEIAKELNARREELAERSRDRKMLENLKERQAMRHAEEESSRERAQLDEIGVLRHGRKDL